MRSGWVCLGWIVVGLLASTAAGQRKAGVAYEPSPPEDLGGAANLFLNADVTESGHFGFNLPALAVNGNHAVPTEHWAAEKLPVWLTVDMGKVREINRIRLWTHWDGPRYYQYLIEGSPDGQAWTTVVDARANKTPATAAGYVHSFPVAKVRYVRTTVTANSQAGESRGHIVEIEGYSVPAEVGKRHEERAAAWKKVPAGLQGAFGSVDVRYAREDVPAPTSGRNWSGVAWRGERLNAQLVLWSAQGCEQLRVSAVALKNGDGRELGPRSLRPSFVRYVLAEGRLVPDVLDEASVLDMSAGSVRPVWLNMDIPADATPGKYAGRVTAQAKGAPAMSFDVEVEVLPLDLPAPRDWKFHLDLWQNPYAVARYHHVEPWSPEHFRLLEPHLRMLAEAGQKCLTASIVYRPWGVQTFDPHDSMIEWIREADGSWRYDYTVFDRWVEFGAKCGIDKAINCFSMVPWSDRIRFRDAKTGDCEDRIVRPGTPEYAEMWRPFLKDFAAHLKAKGWLDRTVIAMDERTLEMAQQAVAMIREAAPGLKAALAGHNEPKFSPIIHDWCVAIGPPALDPALARERSAKGLPTTFYVCCGPARPNTFTFSPPAESSWMGLYAAAMDYTGFLRWAYDSWTEDPLCDTNHVSWPAGDCFLVYPNARSSIRFERLREGIQEFEKVRILRNVAIESSRADVRDAVKALDAALAGLRVETASKSPAADAVNAARAAILTLSRSVARR